jgi:hypothetical protein
MSWAGKCDGCGGPLRPGTCKLFDDGRPAREQFADGKGFVVCLDPACRHKTPVPVVTTDIRADVENALMEAGVKVAPGPTPPGETVH